MFSPSPPRALTIDFLLSLEQFECLRYATGAYGEARRNEFWLLFRDCAEKAKKFDGVPFPFNRDR